MVVPGMAQPVEKISECRFGDLLNPQYASLRGEIPVKSGQHDPKSVRALTTGPFFQRAGTLLEPNVLE
jgi:hypothetical protein